MAKPLLWREGLGALSCQLFGQLRHGTLLRADVSANADGDLVGLSDTAATKDGGTEGTRERVAGSYRVGHIHLGGGLEGDMTGREDVTAVDTTGEDEHAQIVLAEDEPTLVSHRSYVQCVVEAAVFLSPNNLLLKRNPIFFVDGRTAVLPNYNSFFSWS